MKRQEVYKSIDTERDYRESKKPDAKSHIVDDFPLAAGIEALADAYHGGWRKSKKYAKETNFYCLNRSQIREYFDKWYKRYSKL